MAGRQRVGAALVTAAAALGCAETATSGGAPDAACPRSRWECPAGWVAYERGGCGPAAVLCAPGGGAVAGACAQGPASGGLRARPDGGFAGAWHEPGEPGGPPSPDWAPPAGIGSCPEGWRRADDGTCDPRLRTDCPPGSGPLPGGGCTRTAEVDCPAGEFPDVAAESAGAPVLHVRAGAPAERADGSAARPFPTLAGALGRAEPGAWVVLAGGVYPGAHEVTRDVHLVGRCAARVELRGVPGGPADDPTITVRGARLDLRGVTLSGGPYGLYAVAGATARVRSVRVAGVTASALSISGRDGASSARMEDVFVTSDASAPAGNCVEANAGAAVTVERAHLANCRGIGVGANTGSRLTLADAVVRGTRRPSSGTAPLGKALLARAGGRVDAARVVVEATPDVAVNAGDPGSVVTLADGVVRAPAARGEGSYGEGLRASPGGRVEATRVLVEGAHRVAVYASGEGSSLAITEAVVRGSGRAPHERTAPFSAGLAAGQDARLSAERVLVTGAEDPGAVALFGGALELTDTAVRATRPLPDGAHGRGVQVQDRGRLTASRVLVADNPDVGVLVLDEGGEASLADSVVRDAHAPPPVATPEGLRARGGVCVAAQGDARVVAARVLVEGCDLIGAVALDPGARVEFRDGAVRETRGDGPLQFGLQAQGGASLVVERSRVEGFRQSAVSVTGPGSAVEARDVAVRGTRPDAAGLGGWALHAQGGGRLTAERALLDRNVSDAAVATRPGSVVTLRDAVVVGDVSGAARAATAAFAAGGGRVELARVAAVGVRGAGLVSAIAGAASPAGSSLVAEDVFVRGVSDGLAREGGDVIAHGLQVEPGCSMRASRFVVDDGGVGFAHAVGALSLRRGVIARQRTAAGATSVAEGPGAPELEDVDLGCGADRRVRLDAALPRVSLAEPRQVRIDL